MKQEWEILTLGKYLTETESLAGLPWGTTFIRTFEETAQLPKITVGLGLIKAGNNIDLVPPIKHARIVLLNTFINEVAEQYLELSEQTDQWQELLLLGLGYVKKLSHIRNTPNTTFLFSPIPQEERLPLLNKHGFHKIATVVASGYTENIEHILTTLDGLNEELPEEANFGTLMSLLAIGVPVEELEVAVQLPLEMVAEIYGN